MGSESSPNTLPPYPKVVVENNAIVIIHENDSREVWSYEPDGAAARRIARELELELKSMSYIKSHLIESMGEVADELLSMGLSTDVLQNIFEEAFSDIYRNFPKFYGPTTRLVETV